MVLGDLVLTPPLEATCTKALQPHTTGHHFQGPGDPDHLLHWNEHLQDQVPKRSCSKPKRGTGHGPRITTTCREKPLRLLIHQQGIRTEASSQCLTGLQGLCILGDCQPFATDGQEGVRKRELPPQRSWAQQSQHASSFPQSPGSSAP